MCQGMGTASQGLGDFLLSTDTAAASAKVAAAKNNLQDAKNATSAAVATSQRVQQSIGNRRALDAAGSQYTVMQENLSRTIDASTVGTAMGQLRYSQQAGAVAAQAAAAGVGGSSVERMSNTVATQAAQSKALADRQESSVAIDTQSAAAGAIASAYHGMNNQFIAANMDFTYNGKTSYSPLGDLAKLGVAAGLAAAGAPQLANTVLQVGTAQNNAASGDASGAAKAISSGLGSLKGSGQDWSNLFSKVGISFS